MEGFNVIDRDFHETCVVLAHLSQGVYDRNKLGVSHGISKHSFGSVPVPSGRNIKAKEVHFRPSDPQDSLQYGIYQITAEEGLEIARNWGIAVVFKGTTSVADAIKDLNSSSERVYCGDEDTGLRVHEGMYSGIRPHAEKIRQEVSNFLAGIDRQGRRPGKCWLTGHSLGGGLAGCLMMHLLANKNVDMFNAGGGLVTFGAPLILRVNQKDTLESSYRTLKNFIAGARTQTKLPEIEFHHLVNGCDPVPRICMVTPHSLQDDLETSTFERALGAADLPAVLRRMWPFRWFSKFGSHSRGGMLRKRLSTLVYTEEPFDVGPSYPFGWYYVTSAKSFYQVDLAGAKNSQIPATGGLDRAKKIAWAVVDYLNPFGWYYEVTSAGSLYQNAPAGDQDTNFQPIGNSAYAKKIAWALLHIMRDTPGCKKKVGDKNEHSMARYCTNLRDSPQKRCGGSQLMDLRVVAVEASRLGDNLDLGSTSHLHLKKPIYILEDDGNEQSLELIPSVRSKFELEFRQVLEANARTH